MVSKVSQRFDLSEGLLVRLSTPSCASSLVSLTRVWIGGFFVPVEHDGSKAGRRHGRRRGVSARATIAG